MLILINNIEDNVYISLESFFKYKTKGPIVYFNS